MPRKFIVPANSRNGSKAGSPVTRTAMSLPNVGIGGKFMPNFGVDLDMEMSMNMQPALTNPGAPGRPTNPSVGGRKKQIRKSSGNSGTFASAKPVGGTILVQPNLPFGAIPTALATPPAPGHKSKAGIPPPPSHGKRSLSKASNHSVKLDSLSRSISPVLNKSLPLPKITAGKKSNKRKEKVDSALSDIEMVLFGHISEDLPQIPSRVVRVFLSSTFSDMKAERNEIWTSVYPAVRSHCIAHELDFSFVDMRWGVLDFATDHHKTEEIVLSEAKRTIKSSAATSFLSIIGHRYGSVVNDSTIPAEKFEILLKTAQDNNLKDCSLLETWYKRDENQVPPVYALQPISSIISDYNSSDKDKHSVAADEWQKTSSLLWEVRYSATKHAAQSGKLSQSEVDNVEKSVTTTEIEVGIIDNPHAAGTTYSVYRTLKGVEEDIEGSRTYKFIDIDDSGDKPKVNSSNQQKIEKYIVNPVKQTLMPESRKMYAVVWHTGGIPQAITDQSESDRKYLETFSSDLVSYLTKAVDLHLQSVTNEATEYDPKISSDSNLTGPKSTEKHVCTQECVMRCALANKQALMAEYQSMEDNTQVMLSASDYKEILHHLNLAYLKTQLFCGRKEQLNLVKDYLTGSNWNVPLMVGGASGGGKTPFAGQVAKLAQKWMGEKAVVVVRFIGSSVQAEQVHPALRTIIAQLSCAYQIPTMVSSKDTLKTLTHKFHKLMHAISFTGNCLKRPCLIVLDGLEHLSENNNSHSLCWLPTKLPPHVFLVATYNGSEFGLEETVKTRFDRHLELPIMTTSDMMSYVDISLKHMGRKVTPEQRKCMEQGLITNPQPVYAQLLVNLAKETASYDDVSEKMNHHSTEAAVNQLIDGLEQKYGEKFVRYSLAYLTIGHTGISEAELEDVLSCSDEVLIEVFVYHEPPKKGKVRIPPHLWPMLRKELDQFIVEKSTHDYILLTWYHKAVADAVCKRYLSDEQQVKHYHMYLAEIYASPHGVQRSITLSRLRVPLSVPDADRGIACYMTDKRPVRYLYSMIHHLAKIEDLGKLKEMTVCNLMYMAVVWKKIELAAMSKITAITMNESAECRQDKELGIMLSFFESQMSFVSGKPFSHEALLDLCVIIVGSLPQSEETPCISSLIDMAHKHINDWKAAVIVPTRGCIFFKQDKLRWHSSGYTSIAASDSNSLSIALNTKSNKSIDGVELNAFNSVNMTRKTKILKVALSQRRVFALTEKAVIIKSVGTSKNNPALTISTDSVSKGEHLNHTMAVSESGRLLCLGGRERLGVFEDKAQFTAVPNYKGVSTLGLGGVKSTDAVVFTPDEKYTISAHTISAKGKCIGGIVKWLHESKTTEARVSVPSPVLKGCLYLLPEEDTVLCACDHNEILKVSLKTQQIVDRTYSGPDKWTNISVDASMLGLLLDNETVKVWHLEEKKFAEFESNQTPTCLAVLQSAYQAFIGTKQGCIEIYNVRDGKLIKSVSMSSSSIVEICVVGEQSLIVLNEHNNVYTLSIEAMLKDTVMDDEDAPNSLGESVQGLFSSDAETLLVQRSEDEPISLYNTTNLNKVDVSATKGFSDVVFCGGTSYLVGKTGQSVKVWNLGQGQEVTPPAPVADIFKNYEAYYASDSEPVIMFAGEGYITEWTIGDTDYRTLPYNGSCVSMIRFSQTFTVLALRSGTRETDGWVIQVIDRSNGNILVSEEGEEKICDIMCNDACVLMVRYNTCYYINPKSGSLTEVELSEPVQHIGMSDQYHVLLHGEEISMYDSATGNRLGHLDIGQKVSSIIYTSETFTVIAMPMGVIQVIKWHQTSAVTQSNMVQTTCNHLSAVMNKNNDKLYVYGRLLNESRFFSFSLKNF